MNVKFDVTGMTCAACAARVEKAARSVPGVANAEVNLLANTLRTEVPNPETAQAVISAVEQAGYHALRSQAQSLLPRTATPRPRR